MRDHDHEPDVGIFGEDDDRDSNQTHDIEKQVAEVADGLASAPAKLFVHFGDQRGGLFGLKVLVVETGDFGDKDLAQVGLELDIEDPVELSLGKKEE